MDADRRTGFECAACGAERPVDAVQYDALGYPECPACAARTGPLVSVEAVEAVEKVEAAETIQTVESGITDRWRGKVERRSPRDSFTQAPSSPTGR